MAATVLKFDLHPSQKKFLEQSERGLYPVAQPAGQAVPFRTSTPSQTASSTPEAVEQPKRHVPPENDMSFLHRMVSLECLDCGHDWIQPSEKGRCVKCRSENTRVFMKRVSELERV